MKPRVCVCCGEPISEKENALWRYPNMCASCSSLPEGLVEAEHAGSAPANPPQPMAGESPEEFRKAA